MRKNIVAENWKMNNDLDESRKLVEEINSALGNDELNCESIFTSTNEIDSGDIKVKTKGNFTIEEEADDDKTYVPDDHFEEALIGLGYDDIKDDFVLTNNIETVEVLHIAEKQISDLTGIEGFRDLIELVCYSNQLTSLDISQNTALKLLNLDNNQLVSLNISQNVR